MQEWLYNTLSGLPEVPAEQRPKQLPVNDAVSAECRQSVAALGWQLIDVRLLPMNTDGDRVQIVKLTLDGVRMGTIALGKDQVKLLEMEAKTLGLLGSKEQADDATDKYYTLDELKRLFTYAKKMKTKKASKAKDT